MRQLLTESMFLAALGGAAGLALSFWTMNSLVAFIPPEDIPAKARIGINYQVLAFTMGVSLLTGMIFGLVPALQSAATNLGHSLKEGSGKLAGSLRVRRVGNLLVIGEVALSLALLIGAGLLIKSFMRLQQISPGFNPENVLTLHVTLPERDYSEPHQAVRFFQQVIERVQSLPDIGSVGTVSDLPFSGADSGWPLMREGAEVRSMQDVSIVRYRLASPDYFRTMGIPILQGRPFYQQDTRESPGVVMINQSLAHQFFPGEDSIGKQVRLAPPDNLLPPAIARLGLEFPWVTVVGVVGDVKHFGLMQESRPEVYVPHDQGFDALGLMLSMTIVARTTSDPMSMASTLREQVWSNDKNLPITRLKTMEQLIADSVSQPRSNMLLLGIFAAMALILAAIGIYGVVSYSVTQRTHEIGIRAALGAKPGDVLKLVMGQGFLLIVTGIALGLGLAIIVTRLMAGFLYGVSATDAAIFIGVPVLLAIVALAACYVPARRATKVDPMEALRYE